MNIPKKLSLQAKVAVIILTIALVSVGGALAAYYLTVTVPVTVSAVAFGAGSGITTGSCLVSGTTMTCTPATMIIGTNVTLTVVINNPTSTAAVYTVGFDSADHTVAHVVLYSIGGTIFSYPAPSHSVTFAASTTTTLVFNIVPVAGGSTTVTVTVGP
jgi:hypothetical protein